MKVTIKRLLSGPMQKYLASLKTRPGLLLGVLLFSMVAGYAGIRVSQGAGLDPAMEAPGISVNPDEPTEQIVVEYKADSDIQALRNKFGRVKAREVDEVKKYRVKILKVPRSQRDQALASLASDPQVKTAEIDPVWTSFVTTPNDPEYSVQWAWPKIQANVAWDKSKGDSRVVVAVLDSGMNFGHPDLAGKSVQGTDTVNSDNDPAADNPHGTQVAGTIAPLTNNGLGVAGGCWNCKIMPVKVLNDKGSSVASSVLKGIEYASNNGAKIINMSLGGSGSSSAVQTAITEATSKGIIVVASAGNNGRDDDRSVPQYPANYSGVVSVAATDQADLLTDYSSFWNNVDIAAPGQVRTTSYPGEGYATVNGTSFSAPVVSSIIALLASQYPQATPAELIDAVVSTTDVCCDGKIGGGRINAAEAQAKLAVKYPTTTPPPTTPPPTTPPPTTPPPPTPPPTPTKPDLNGDGKVNITDLSILLSAWGTSNPTADLNKSGKVDITDMSMLLSGWG